MHKHKCVEIFSRISQSLFFHLFSAVSLWKYFSLSFHDEHPVPRRSQLKHRRNHVPHRFFPLPSLTADPFLFLSLSLLTANFNIHEDININKNININIDIYEYECRCVNIHGTEYYTRIESSRKAKRRGDAGGKRAEGEGELQVQTIPGGLKGTPSTAIRHRYRQRSHSYKRRRKLSRW